MNFEKEIRAALKKYAASSTPGWLKSVSASFYSRMRQEAVATVVDDLEKLNFDAIQRTVKWLDTEALMASPTGAYHHYAKALIVALEAENKALRKALKTNESRKKTSSL